MMTKYKYTLVYYKDHPRMNLLEVLNHYGNIGMKLVPMQFREDYLIFEQEVLTEI